ncbi:MAG TPA: glutamate--cysteine ligase [Egibacteraceae bacterium]|nr:glutamate--cysteine ligase [Egibacteraceae bacterium]
MTDVADTPGPPAGQFTIGIEEEFHLVDPVTRSLTPDAELVLSGRTWDERVVAELQRSMIETRTGVCRTLGQLRDQLVDLRRELIAAAGEVERWVVAAGTVPSFDWRQQRITPDPRFERMAHDFQHVAREQLICGCQTHIGIDDPEVAIQVMNRARGWLPTLLALSASSPYWAQVDTGYASYRAAQWRRWPTAGMPQQFESRAAYDTIVETLVAVGVIADPGMLYWDVRPSDRHHTLEFRIPDACPTVDEVVLQAGLARAIARTCHDEVTSGAPPSPVPWELLNLAAWQAARFGLTGALVDVQAGRTVSAGERVRQLLAYVRPALEEEGDWEEIASLIEALLLGGTSSERQRRAYTRRGRAEDVVDHLVAETGQDVT